jgi:SAM-dependent methyltransferase
MPSHRAIIQHNQIAWDNRARGRRRFTTAASDSEFVESLHAIDQCGWLGGDVQGKKLLCLAAGGGRHAALYAAAGAEVTVVDLSAAQLELDREIAAERNLRLRTVHTSMDDLSMFQPGEFEIVVHPVSTCYVPQIRSVFQQIARVTIGGGLYISQHKQPTSLQADTRPTSRGYELIHSYYHSDPLPEVVGSLHREPGTMEFLHGWQELIGGICRSGFVVEDLIEPYHADALAPPGTFAHRSYFVAPYVRIKARRKSVNGREVGSEKRLNLWLPTD